MAVDPVELVRGPAREPGTFRCPRCGLRQRHAEILPTGGVTCTRCEHNLNVRDRVVYATPRARVAAGLVDVASLLLPFLLLTVLPGFSSPLVPTDAHGHVTPRAMFVLRCVSAAYFTAYLWMCEALGSSFGKQFTGIRVVRASNWRRPGIFIGLIRGFAKVVTVATFGLGFVVMVWDSEGRTLHDRLAGTRVIEH